MSQESTRPLLLGLNFPFCSHRCAYCPQQSQVHTEVALRLAVGRLERLEAVDGSALGEHLSPLLKSGELENTEEGCRLTPLGIASGALYRLG